MRMYEHASGSIADLPLSGFNDTSSELHPLSSDVQIRYLQWSHAPITFQITTGYNDASTMIGRISGRRKFAHAGLL